LFCKGFFFTNKTENFFYFLVGLKHICIWYKLGLKGTGSKVVD
jgi:hypothetical protein